MEVSGALGEAAILIKSCVAARTLAVLMLILNAGSDPAAVWM